MRSEESHGSSLEMNQENVICLLKVEFLLSATHQKDARYYLHHKKKGHTLEQCFTFKRISNEKHNEGEILFEEGAIIINDLSFPKHNDRRKGQVVASHREMEINRNEHKVPERARSGLNGSRGT